MLNPQNKLVCAAAALMTAVGCGNAISNSNGSDGPTSSTNSTNSASAASDSGGASSGVLTSSVSSGTTSTGGGPSDPDCRLPDAEDLAIDNPVNESENLFNDVLAEQLERLYEFVGQYASGETPLFRGQLQGLEDRTALSVSEILTLNSTRAVASLSYEDALEDSPVAAGHLLTAFDPDARRVVRVMQPSNEPNSTYVGYITTFYNSGGFPATCSDCLVDLATVQDDLSFDLSAHGHYTDTANTPLQVDVEGHFSRIPIHAITLDDILTASAVANSPFREVEPRMDADLVVFEVRDSAIAGQDENGCNIIRDYEIEWFVRTSCLLDYGVRNLVIDGPPRGCGDDG